MAFTLYSSLYYKTLLLTKLDDKVIMHLQKCGKCNRIIELMGFRAGTEGFDSLLYKILHDSNNTLKIEFDEFYVYCPVHKNDTEGSTYLKMEEDEVELLKNTPLHKIWLTVD